MAKAKGNKWYYSLSSLVRLILAIIPFTAWIVHAFARITSGKTLGIVIGIISLFGVGFILWIIDLVTTILGMRLLFS